MYAERAIPTRVLRGDEDLTSGLRTPGEVDPPQRHAAEEGHHERGHRDRGRLDLAESRAGYQDGLSQGDDDEQLAALGGVPAFDCPHFGGGPAETRYVETDERPRGVLHDHGERPQHVARFSSSKPPMIHNTPDAKSQKNIRWKFLLSGADLPRDLFRAIPRTRCARPVCSRRPRQTSARVPRRRPGWRRR